MTHKYRHFKTVVASWSVTSLGVSIYCTGTTQGLPIKGSVPWNVCEWHFMHIKFWNVAARKQAENIDLILLFADVEGRDDSDNYVICNVCHIGYVFFFNAESRERAK